MAVGEGGLDGRENNAAMSVRFPQSWQALLPRAWRTASAEMDSKSFSSRTPIRNNTDGRLPDEDRVEAFTQKMRNLVGLQFAPLQFPNRAPH